jgi:tetratricopeptide (TPR) repeat protein
MNRQEVEMFSIKDFKLCLYKQLARFPRVYFYYLIFVVLVLLITAALLKIPLSPGSILNTCRNVFIYAAFPMLLLLPVILIWGWYFVWFRYAAYGIAWIISLIRRLFKSIYFQIIIVLALSAGFWDWRKRLLLGKKYNPNEILLFSSVIKILVITAAVFTIMQIIKSRKRLFISNFENYTGDNQLDPAVKGIAGKLLNEMNKLLKLLQTIDEIQPESVREIIEPGLDVREMEKGFSEIIGQESSVAIGAVKIPLRPVYAFFNKMVRGPILSGGVHLKGEKLVVTACLKGGKLSGSWEISTDDIEKPGTARSEQVMQISVQLVCRIIAHLAQGGSPRWKAMQHYAEALRLYRETLRTIEKRRLNLIKAKNECSLALRDDSSFVQCYYNLGIIYDKLGSSDAAIAAFRKALESAPDNYYCYYQLARLYYKNDKYFDARWFCQQALTIFPTEAEHWNLWAVIRFKKDYKIEIDNYKDKVKDIDKEVVQYLMTASALAWRALCKAIIKGEKILQFKEDARVCIRNLALITGMKKQRRSSCLVKQAIFLAPDNNDLYFESGSAYYRRNKTKKAYEAFKRVFEDDKEVNDPFSYWAYYINVNAKLYEKKGDPEYKEHVQTGFFHFLDAAAKIIQSNEKKPEDRKIHEEQVSEALSIIKKKDENLESAAVDIKDKIAVTLNSVKSSIEKKKDEKLGAAAVDIIDKILAILNSAKPSSQKVKMENGMDKEFLSGLIDILKDNNDRTDIIHSENKTNQKIIDCINKWPTDFCRYNPELSVGFLKWVIAQVIIKSAIFVLDKKKEGDIKSVIRLTCAISLLEEKNPKEAKILGLYEYLGEAYYRLELYHDALEQARKAVRLNPYDWKVRKLLGNIYYELKDFQKAVDESEISARFDEITTDELIVILKEIGKAYEEKGKILWDPEQRKNSFNKAIESFTDSLVILEDKSYENKDGNIDSDYTRRLGETHFSLGTYYCELLQYENAVTHFKIAVEMNYKIVNTLMKIGWTCIESGDFNEAGQAFEKAESGRKEFNKKYRREKDSNGTSAEIKLGIVFSQVERTLHIDKKKSNFCRRLSDVRTLFHLFHLPGDKDPLSILKDVKKTIKKVTQAEEKARLWALYYECRGRIHFKQEEFDKAEKAFEKSLSCQASPRVYYYLAQLYWKKAGKSGAPWKNPYLAKTRSAFILCLKNDLQQKYKSEVSVLLEKFNAFEKQQTKPKLKTQS